VRAGDEEELAVGADGVGSVYVEGEGAGEEAVGVEFAEVTAGGEGVGEVGVGVVAADDVAEVVGFVGAEDGGAAAQRLCFYFHMAKKILLHENKEIARPFYILNFCMTDKE